MAPIVARPADAGGDYRAILRGPVDQVHIKRVKVGRPAVAWIRIPPFS
jgi:hypothetical protein